MEVNIYKGHEFPEAQGVCVVIDVLRAFTTAAFAFDAGVKEIVFVATADEAFHKSKSDPSLLLTDESEGLRIDGFHFENSPSEMLQASLSGQRMVQRTSSGTQGVVGCRHASKILVASFVVAQATVDYILNLNPTHVSLIATGRKNGDEDLALAEYLKSKLLGEPADIISLLERVRLSPAAQRMLHGPKSYQNGLLDLELALKLDHFPFAMQVNKENNDLIGKPVFS